MLNQTTVSVEWNVTIWVSFCTWTEKKRHLKEHKRCRYCESITCCLDTAAEKHFWNSFCFFFFSQRCPTPPHWQKVPHTHTHKSRATSESIISQMCGFAALKRSCFTCRQRTHLAARMNFRPTFFLKKKVKTKKHNARADGEVSLSPTQQPTKGAFATPYVSGVTSQHERRG